MVYNASVRIGTRGEEQCYTLRLSLAGGPTKRGPPVLATSVQLGGSRGARGLEQDFQNTSVSQGCSVECASQGSWGVFHKS